MSLDRLTVKDVRNVSSLDLEFHPRLNLFGGKNGSGKSSLLESIHFLGHARPIRGKRLKPFVKRGANSCLVVGALSHLRYKSHLGVQRSLDGKHSFRINGVKEAKTSELAKQLPSLYLGPDTVDLLLGSPGVRRKFLNWGVFHVEPNFSNVWLEANRSLRQRNNLVRKSSMSSQELSTWTGLLTKQSEQINKYRECYLFEFVEVFNTILGSLTSLQAVKCEYHRGWKAQSDLSAVYEEQLDGDLRKGFTQSGFQRADLKVTIDGNAVTTVCSRGELKVLAWTLVLAQGVLYAKALNRQLIYLVDDMVAELDSDHCLSICRHLHSGGYQIFATGIDAAMLNTSWEGVPRKEFHVEHGTFLEKENEK